MKTPEQPPIAVHPSITAEELEILKPLIGVLARMARKQLVQAEKASGVERAPGLSRDRNPEG